MDPRAIADQLLDPYDSPSTMDPIAATDPGFDSSAAYAVLDEITARRREMGWESVGRKIGFTNRTIWEIFNVDRPMWAHIWTRTTSTAVANQAASSLRPFVARRVEPEIVFKLNRRLVVGAPISRAELSTLEPADLLAGRVFEESPPR